MIRRDLHPLVFVIDDFLSAADCQAQIDRAEAAGFDEAPITTSRGPVMRTDIRNNTRVMIDDAELARGLWNRAAPLLPAEWGQPRWPTVGLNERFRYYRYDPGQKFAQHFDGRFQRSPVEESRLTFMVYLNDGFTGGETLFWLDTHGHDEPDLTVTPRTGLTLIFEHRVLHEGGEIASCRKYVLRSDVMCRVPTRATPVGQGGQGDSLVPVSDRK